MTFTANVTAGIAAAVAGDYCFIQGDFGTITSGVPPSSVTMRSDSWTASSSGSVERSARCPPSRVGSTERSTPKKAVALGAELGIQASRPDIIAPKSPWMNLAKLMGSKVVYSERSDYEGILGFRSLKVMGPSGDVDIVADPDAQSDES